MHHWPTGHCSPALVLAVYSIIFFYFFLFSNIVKNISILLISTYFYLVDCGSDILLAIEQYYNLKLNDMKFDLTNLLKKNFTKSYCSNLDVNPVSEIIFSEKYILTTACTPAGYLGGQEEIKSHCELCKF